MAADPSYPDSEIARLIRHARIRKGLSHARLGAAVGRTATTIRRWERGEEVPPEDALDGVAAALGVNQSALARALRGPDAHVVVPAPVTSDDPADIDTSVSGADGSIELAGAPVDATPIRPGIALVRPGDDTSGEVAVVPDGEKTEKAWIDVSSEQITATSPARQPMAAAAKPQPAAPAAGTATTSLSDPTERVPQVVAPPQAVAVGPQMGWRQLPSYVEDPRERWRYVLRFILTAVALVIMAYIALWASGELFSALGDAVDLFSDPEDVTATTTVFSTP